MKRLFLLLILFLTGAFGLTVVLPANAETSMPVSEKAWVMPILKNGKTGWPCPVVVWFDRQFLENGEAYQQKKIEYSGQKRSDLRRRVTATLKQYSDDSWRQAAGKIEALERQKKIDQVERHWIVNGFSCRVSSAGALADLAAVPGVDRIFARVDALPFRPSAGQPRFYPAAVLDAFNPGAVECPWYIKKLEADRVWREFGVYGQNTLNVIHDSNFTITPGLITTLYRNPGEIPANGKDDDGNGRVDDVHGFNFDSNNADLTPIQDAGGRKAAGVRHGSWCAAMVCGAEQGKTSWVPGLAPRGRWAGIIGHGRIEAMVEWAVGIGADTYSMSFSLPGLGQYRTHWRKVMEHGSLCGLVFVSGAGNFARREKRNFAPVPVQMRVPEDIPEAVFSAAGVGRDLVRPPFSSQGPVQWMTDYYRDGQVPKPDVSTFNVAIPVLTPDGEISGRGVSGNSFAGAMLSGAVALILSADPETLPWDLRDIMIKTAMDVDPAGFDYQTGHGLINCYRAVQEVRRRTGQSPGTNKKE